MACGRLVTLTVWMVAALQMSGAPSRADELTWPPRLPGRETVVTDTSKAFITAPKDVKLRPGVRVARTAPTIDFAYFQGQTHAGRPWSVWGDGLGVGEHLYYTSIGDHLAPRGRAQVYEFNAQTRTLRMLVDIREFLENGNLPKAMDYTPGKIHSRIDLGSDGWLYYSTHRGSTRDNTTDARGYLGDWIFRTNPETGETRIAAAYPLEKHTIPASVLDPERMIYYGGTAAGNDAPVGGVRFLAYDVAGDKKLLEAAGGFPRYAILAQSTGRVYWRERDEPTGRVYDPATNRIRPIALPEVRAATRETAGGIVYAFSQNQLHDSLPKPGHLWAFDVSSARVTDLGYAMSGERTYVAATEVDPSNGRYVYYVGGAHGGIAGEGTPIMQFDVRTRTAKVIAFTTPFYREKYGYTPDGTFGIGISSDGATLCVTWNGNRTGQSGSRHWDACALMAIHIPESERRP